MNSPIHRPDLDALAEVPTGQRLSPSFPGTAVHIAQSIAVDPHTSLTPAHTSMSTHLRNCQNTNWRLTFQKIKQLNYFQSLIWPVWYQLSTGPDISCFLKYSVYGQWVNCWWKYCLVWGRGGLQTVHTVTFSALSPSHPTVPSLPRRAWLILYNCFFLASNCKILLKDFQKVWEILDLKNFWIISWLQLYFQFLAAFCCWILVLNISLKPWSLHHYMGVQIHLSPLRVKCIIFWVFGNKIIST